MDIATTIDVDVDIETERNEAMMKATGMLVTSLTKNGDIPKNTEDKCMNLQLYVTKSLMWTTCPVVFLLSCAGSNADREWTLPCLRFEVEQSS